MKKLVNWVVGGALCVAISPMGQAADVSAQYNLCVSEVKSVYGDDTVVSLKKTKKHSGVTTLKLKVVPEASSATTVVCSSEVSVPDTVVLLDKEGEPLLS
jgi:hypothetical protein